MNPKQYVLVFAVATASLFSASCKRALSPDEGRAIAAAWVKAAHNRETCSSNLSENQLKRILSESKPPVELARWQAWLETAPEADRPETLAKVKDAQCNEAKRTVDLAREALKKLDYIFIELTDHSGAKTTCSENGKRLPTIAELGAIYRARTLLPMFAEGRETAWASDTTADGGFLAFAMVGPNAGRSEAYPDASPMPALCVPE